MKKSNAKEEVLEVINNTPGVDTKTIASNIDYGTDTVRRACAALVKEGLVTREQVQNGSIRKFLFTPKVKEVKKELISKVKESVKESADIRNAKKPKNHNKVTFKGEELGKAKLVKAIILDFITNNKVTYEELSNKVNFDVNGRRVYPKYDVIRKTTDSNVRKSMEGKYKRYYVNSILTTSDGVDFVVCREWGLDNIDKDFIMPIANEQLGYVINTYKA